MPLDAATACKPRLLIVDDDPLIAESLGYVLGADFDIHAAATRMACVSVLRALPDAPDLALVDLGLPPTPHRPDEGFALISDLLAHAPGIRIVVLSGQNDEANARHARALGAAEYIAKPADPALLRQTLLRLAGAGTPGVETPALVGESPAIAKVRAQARQFADSPFPVLIEGESGSGKDVLARVCLHEDSVRRARPYLAVNCAAIAPTLLEPTLFGHARGAFTGAATGRAGYFEDAAEGTLFLDEIGELPLELQPKLLRVLENGEFQRVGETQMRSARCRVIAATNRDLRNEVRAGRFRPDLYHRLSVFTIAMPPLRDMGEDRLRLLEHFRRQLGAAADFQLAPAARALWLDYQFPGNVRELRNIVIRLGTKYPGASVARAQLEAELDLLDEARPPAPEAPTADPRELAEQAARHLSRREGFSLDRTLRQWEQAYIDAALHIAHGNVSHAARLLGLHRTTLYNRMDALARDLAASGEDAR